MMLSLVLGAIIGAGVVEAINAYRVRWRDEALDDWRALQDKTFNAMIDAQQEAQDSIKCIRLMQGLLTAASKRLSKGQIQDCVREAGGQWIESQGGKSN